MTRGLVIVGLGVAAYMLARRGVGAVRDEFAVVAAGATAERKELTLGELRDQGQRGAVGETATSSPSGQASPAPAPASVAEVTNAGYCWGAA